MAILIDTNILLRSVQPSHSMHPLALHALKTLHARLAAVMKANGIARILTFNVQDSKRFAGIEAVHPSEI